MPESEYDFLEALREINGVNEDVGAISKSANNELSEYMELADLAIELISAIYGGTVFMNLQGPPQSFETSDALGMPAAVGVEFHQALGWVQQLQLAMDLAVLDIDVQRDLVLKIIEYSRKKSGLNADNVEFQETPRWGG